MRTLTPMQEMLTSAEQWWCYNASQYFISTSVRWILRMKPVLEWAPSCRGPWILWNSCKMNFPCLLEWYWRGAKAVFGWWNSKMIISLWSNYQILVDRSLFRLRKDLLIFSTPRVLLACIAVVAVLWPKADSFLFCFVFVGMFDIHAYMYIIILNPHTDPWSGW